MCSYCIFNAPFITLKHVHIHFFVSVYKKAEKSILLKHCYTCKMHAYIKKKKCDQIIHSIHIP